MRLQPKMAALAVVALSLLAPLAPARGQDTPRFDKLPPSIREWIYAEQKLLSRAVDERRIVAPRLNHQDPEFTPEKGSIFEVKTYWVDASKMDGFLGDNIPASVRDEFVRTKDGETQYRFAVHPESESLYASVLQGAERGPSLWATATASSRTLLVWQSGHESEPFFAKLSLNKEIGGVVRTIPKSEVVRSVGINNVLAGEESALPGSFRFMPEVASMIPKGMPRGGMILREIPPEILSGQAKYVPLFSLYASPPDGGPPLLARMIARSGMDPAEFVKTKIVEPMAKQWFEMVVDHGVQMEPHAQNVLIELGQDGLPTGRFLHRDLGGFTVDLNYRKKLGLETRASLPFIDDFDAEYHLERAKERLRDVRVYFSGGFLYNIDQELPKWQAKGWVGGSPVESGTFERAFDGAMNRELAARNGKALPTATDAELVAATQAARDRHEKLLLEAKARAATHPSGIAGFFERGFEKVIDVLRRYDPLSHERTHVAVPAADEAGSSTTGATGADLARMRGASRTTGVDGALDGRIRDRVEDGSKVGDARDR